MRLSEHLSAARDRRPRGRPVARRCLAGAVLCVTAVVAWASPAGASPPVDALCTGTIDQSWDPGLRLTDRSVHYTAELVYHCESSDADVDGAEIHVDAVYTSNCLVNAGPASATVEWNTGETSEIEIESVAVTAGASQVYEALGSVTDGKFTGDTVQMLNTFVSVDLLACFTTQGMEHRSGITTMTLLGI